MPTTDRILDISMEGARLRVEHSRLRIDREEHEPVTVPLDEIAVLVVSHPAVTYTHAVLAECAGRGAPLVVCDRRHLPTAMLLPLTGHHRQSERMARQAAASKPLQKRLWQQIVHAKVAAQGALLRRHWGSDRGLCALADRVRSGDPDNLEGQAARSYWPVVFGDPAFRRDRDGGGLNNLLNYGYSVLRALTARAICAAGLHPSLGLHHHNRYDPFPLADDLMEPYRPRIDEAVIEALHTWGPKVQVEPDVKQILIGALYEPVDLEGERRSLFDAVVRMAASVALAYEGEGKTVQLPAL